MKRTGRLKNLLAAGINSSLAEKAIKAGLKLSDLRTASKKSLQETFVEWEMEQIQEILQRQPIPDNVIEQLINRCDWSCCLCWNFDVEVPIVIHHLEEHSKGGEDSYDNLVILCLNHHGIAHSNWQISRHPAPAEFIRQRKKDFEAAITESTTGKRPAPGREGNASTPETQSDVEALKRIAGFLNRPAVFRPFRIEGNMSDFLEEMSNTILALNTGHLKTRQGDKLGDIKPYLQFSNPQWRERMGLVRDQFDTLRARVEVAIRDGELHVRPEDGFYSFENPELPEEIDAMRHTVVSMLNLVFKQADIPPIRAPNNDDYQW